MRTTKAEEFAKSLQQQGKTYDRALLCCHRHSNKKELYMAVDTLYPKESAERAALKEALLKLEHPYSLAKQAGVFDAVVLGAIRDDMHVGGPVRWLNVKKILGMSRKNSTPKKKTKVLTGGNSTVKAMLVDLINAAGSRKALAKQIHVDRSHTMASILAGAPCTKMVEEKIRKAHQSIQAGAANEKVPNGRANCDSSTVLKQLQELLQSTSMAELQRKIHLSRVTVHKVLDGKACTPTVIDKILQEHGKLLGRTERRQRDVERKVVHKSATKMMAEGQGEKNQPSPRADALRNIIAGARDPQLCGVMRDMVPIVKKHNGATEKAIILLHQAMQENMPIQFVVEAMSA